VATVTALAAMLGAGMGIGLILFARGLHCSPDQPNRWLETVRPKLTQRRLLHLGAAAAAGVLAAAITGWLVAAVLAAAAVWTLPRALGRDRDAALRVARFEAIAAWAEMLRDTLAAAAGLEQAITVTAPLTPVAIREHLITAADRLETGYRLPGVLRELAGDLDDPTADLVITALVLASEQRARNLGELLGSLAQAAREHAALRLRVEASRAQTRTAARITVATTLVFAVGLVLLDRHYLTAYDPAGGQLVLLIVGGLFAARIARMPAPARLLAPWTASPTGRPDDSFAGTH
jgi:tight adherence protein B